MILGFGKLEFGISGFGILEFEILGFGILEFGILEFGILAFGILEFGILDISGKCLIRDIGIRENGFGKRYIRKSGFREIIG